MQQEEVVVPPIGFKLLATNLAAKDPDVQDTIEFVTIATTGDAIDFGDLSVTVAYNGACSNGHGGL